MKNLIQNFTLVALLLILFSTGSFSQIISPDTLNIESAKKWFDAKTWSKGPAVNPHSSINMLEFAKQYFKNKAYWDKAIEFLNNPGLADLKPGKYNIDSTFVVATISYAESSDSNKVKWEAHRKYLDLQTLISGNAFYAIAPFNKEDISEQYNDSTDILHITTNNGKYYKSVPGTLFVFFPSDAHKGAIKENTGDIVKRVVIKIIYTW
jgi:biofilm protein TabA